MALELLREKILLSCLVKCLFKLELIISVLFSLFPLFSFQFVCLLTSLFFIILGLNNDSNLFIIQFMADEIFISTFITGTLIKLMHIIVGYNLIDSIMLDDN